MNKKKCRHGGLNQAAETKTKNKIMNKIKIGGVMIPTINDFTSYLYTDEQRKLEIYEKYFQQVDKNMCVNEKTIKMDQTFMAVADYVAKEYLIYKNYYENKTNKDIHNELKLTMEHYQLKMIDSNLLGNFLKNVHIKGKITSQAKMVLLSKILDETFLTPKIRKRVHALMKADGYYDLSKMMIDMENVLIITPLLE